MVSLQKLVAQELISQKNVSAITANGEKKSEPSKTKSRASKKAPNSVLGISEEERRQMIASNAYFRAQCRDSSPEDEEADWLAAEAEINATLSNISRN